MWSLCGNLIFAERRMVVPKKKILDTIVWQHDKSGHPGIKGTLWDLQRRFQFPMANKELIEKVEDFVRKCRICAFTKPNSMADRGIVGCLPLPSFVNTGLCGGRQICKFGLHHGCNLWPEQVYSSLAMFEKDHK